MPLLRPCSRPLALEGCARHHPSPGSENSPLNSLVLWRSQIATASKRVPNRSQIWLCLVLSLETSSWNHPFWAVNNFESLSNESNCCQICSYLKPSQSTFSMHLLNVLPPVVSKKLALAHQLQDISIRLNTLTYQHSSSIWKNTNSKWVSLINSFIQYKILQGHLRTQATNIVQRHRWKSWCRFAAQALGALLLASLVFKLTGKLNLGFLAPKFWDVFRLKNVVFTINRYLHGLPM